SLIGPHDTQAAPSALGNIHCAIAFVCNAPHDQAWGQGQRIERAGLYRVQRSIAILVSNQDQSARDPMRFVLRVFVGCEDSHEFSCTISLDFASVRARVPGCTNSISVVTVSSLRKVRSMAALSSSSALAASIRRRNGGFTAGPGASSTICIMPFTLGENWPITDWIADGNTFTPRTINMSSLRPTISIRNPVRPQEQGDVYTLIMSPVRYRNSGQAWRSRWVNAYSPCTPSAISIGFPVTGSISSIITISGVKWCLPLRCRQWANEFGCASDVEAKSYT